jgi:hypothetical protein
MKITDPRQQEILDESCLQYDPKTNRKKMTFASAWNEVQRRRPELFEEEGARPKRMPGPVGYAPGTIATAAEALARAQKRSRTIQASRPLNGSDPEAVTVCGGFAYDLTSGKMLCTQPDGSVVEAVSE